MHQRLSRYRGEQTAISQSLWSSASSISCPRSEESGSSSWSRNTRPIFVRPVFLRMLAGTRYVSIAVCSRLATSWSGDWWR